MAHGIMKSDPAKLTGTPYENRREILAAAAAGEISGIRVSNLAEIATGFADLLNILGELRAMKIELEISGRDGAAVMAAGPALDDFSRRLAIMKANQGVADAQARGVRLGRPPKTDKDHAMKKAKLLLAEGQSKQSIAEELGVSRTTLYRWFREEDSE